MAHQAQITTLCLGRLCLGYRTLPPQTSPLSSLTTFLTTFLFIWLFLLLLLILTQLVHHLTNPLVSPVATQAAKQIVRTHSLLDDAFPLYIVKSDIQSNCAVCIDRVISGHVGRRLRCGHVFHAGCIDRWILQCASRDTLPRCPLCKRGVLEEDGTDMEDGVEVGYDVVYDEAVLRVLV